MSRYATLILVLGLAASCTKRVGVCTSDSDCSNPYPFCDVNGDYPASDGYKNICTILPDNCPPERCGCTPGTTTCNADSLATCNADGRSETTVACDLGCAVDQSHCLAFTPSNGLADALAIAANQDDVEIPPGSGIDPATGVIRDSAGARVLVNSLVLAQQNGPSIRVFIGKSFKIHSTTTITDWDADAIAFVSPGTITVSGLLDISGRGSSGAGSLRTGQCVGLGGYQEGGGGGGNATVGGEGAAVHQLPPHAGNPGGAVELTFEPLTGGCTGGGGTFGTDGQGGYGGGGLELVSMTSISIDASGTIDVAGGGGLQNSGGGSGGNILLEAPAISLIGKLTANGGSGARASGVMQERLTMCRRRVLAAVPMTRSPELEELQHSHPAPAMRHMTQGPAVAVPWVA